MRAKETVDYTLRLSEYTPYCPNNCTGSTGGGSCDCTILRCICEPGNFGDDCSIQPALAELDSYPFMQQSITLAHQGGGEWGRGTLFNQTCPPGHVVVGLTGSYYDYYNPDKVGATARPFLCLSLRFCSDDRVVFATVRSLITSVAPHQRDDQPV